MQDNFHKILKNNKKSDKFLINAFLVFFGNIHREICFGLVRCFFKQNKTFVKKFCAFFILYLKLLQSYKEYHE